VKTFLSISGLCILLGTAPVFAAELKIPMEFEYLAIDGKKIQSNSFRHKSTLEFGQGEHKIAVRYSDVVKDTFGNDGNVDFVKSAPFIISLKADDTQRYILRPDGDGVSENPKAYAKQPKVKITRRDAGVVEYQVTYTDWEEESFVSRLFSGNSARDITASTAVAAAATTAAGVSPAVSATAPHTNVVSGATQTAAPAADGNNQTAETTPKQMLRYWWQQADEKTRKEFMSWVFSAP